MIDEPQGGQAQQLGPNLTSHEFRDVIRGMRAQLEEHDTGSQSQALQATMMAVELMLNDLDSAFVSLNDAADGFEALNTRIEVLQARVNTLEAAHEMTRSGV